MKQHEATNLITLINALWPQRPIEGPAAALVASKLAPFGRDEVARAIDTLSDTDEWFHISKLLKLLKARGETALPAPAVVFRQLRSALLREPSKRDELCGEALNAVAHRLGGWKSVGLLSTEEKNRPFVLKRIEEAIAEVDQIDGVPFTRLSLSACLPVTRRLMAEENLTALPEADND